MRSNWCLPCGWRGPKGAGLAALLFGMMTLSPALARANDAALLFAQPLLASSGSTAFDVVTDSSGNIYATGYFRGTADFDPGPGNLILSAGSLPSDAVFVWKLDPSGGLVWARALAGTNGDTNNWGQGIAVDGAGNVYVTGHFSGTIDFDPGPGTFEMTSAGGTDIFVCKLNSSGDFVWANRAGAVANSEGLAIAVDGAGNVHTTGFFRGAVDFDPGAGSAVLSSESGREDIFVWKLDTNGNFVWARAMTGPDFSRGRGIAVDASGSVYTVGSFQGTVDFDPGAGTFALTAPGSQIEDAFVSKLDANGNFLWALRFGGGLIDHAEAVALDPGGHVLVTGSFRLNADFEPSGSTLPVLSSGGADIFVAKISPSGSPLWVRSMGGGGNFESGLAIAADGAGSVYTTGLFQDGADFDPGSGSFPLAGGGQMDIFVSKLSGLGEFVWAKAMVGSSSNQGRGIAVESAGPVVIAGDFSNTVDFDPGAGSFELTSAASTAGFVVKLSQTAGDGGDPNSPFPDSPTGVPVSGDLGRIGLMISLGICALLLFRRGQVRTSRHSSAP